MSYLSRNKPKKLSPLDRKIKSNPKYATVGAVVNSGNNLQKELERMEEVRQYYKYRPDEIFRRIKITSLVLLMVEVAKLEKQEKEYRSQEEEEYEDKTSDELKYEEGNDSKISSQMEDPCLIDSIVDTGKKISLKYRSDLASSLGDLISDREVIENPHQEGTKEQNYARPFLILDVRPKSNFELNGSIIHAVNYPLSSLTRSVNFETAAMLRFKVGLSRRKIIVIIDEDESLSSKAGTTLVERGYENVFILSGGLKVARILFPEKLIGVFSEEHNYLSAHDEEDILHLESLCDEASTRGRSSRLSSYAPSTSKIGSSFVKWNKDNHRMNGLMF